MSILFKGNNKALIVSINALLALDAKGALAPHGIGEMARDLLETCAARLPAEQHQGEPVAWFTEDHLTDKSATTWDGAVADQWRAKGWPVSQLYTHADTGELDALRGAYLRAGEREHELRTELAQLRAALKFYADRDHYSTDDGLNWDSCSGEPANILWHESEPWFIEDGAIARAALAGSAEPSAPIPKSECPHCLGDSMFGCTQCQPDELTDPATWKRRAIEAESKLRTYDPQVVELGAQAMQALLAEPKPSELVLTKCKLCDQLQADLTKLDEKLDQTQDLLRYMVHDYRSVVQAGYDRITALGSDCDSVAKMLDDNPNYQKALTLLLPDLESRPEERGTPETEPCSGCGTPGYTGNCDKCVPY